MIIEEWSSWIEEKNGKTREKAYLAKNKVENDLKKRKTFIIDSGATVHLCNDLSMFQNLESCKIKVQGANNEVMTCKKKGCVKLFMKNG